MSYTDLASENTIDRVVNALRIHNFEPLVVETKEEALQKIKEIIPEGVSVMNGTSKTLEEIGYIDYLKSGEHTWNNLHAAIISEKDLGKQALLRRQAVLSDYYLGSVHALSETGELIIASNTGSQMPHIVYTSPNVIFVISTQKITPDLNTALQRLQEYVVPLESARLKALYGVNTTHSKTLIYHQESSTSKRKIRVILVKEKLGF
jgi:hypothetical protein